MSVSILPASGLAQDEQGYTLLQVIVALAVMGVLTVTVGPGIMDKLESFIAISQSSTQEKVADLAKRYTTDNNQAVMTATAGGAIEVTMQDLRTANLLSASEVDASGARPEVFNSYGARMIVLARNVGGTGLEVITYPLGGTDSSLQADADVVTALGGRAGFVLSGEAECGAGITLCAKGNGGNWSINLAHFDNAATNAVLPSGGEVITLDYIGQGQVTGPELYRTAVAGRPELNQMATDLGGGGNNITDFLEYRPTGTAAGGGLTASRMTTLRQLNVDHSSGSAAVTATASTLAIRGADGTLIAAEPTADTHLATKGYVDGASGGGGSSYFTFQSMSQEYRRDWSSGFTEDIFKGRSHGDVIVSCRAYPRSLASPQQYSMLYVSLYVYDSSDVQIGTIWTNVSLQMSSYENGSNQPAGHSYGGTANAPVFMLKAGQYLRVSGGVSYTAKNGTIICNYSVPE